MKKMLQITEIMSMNIEMKIRILNGNINQNSLYIEKGQTVNLIIYSKVNKNHFHFDMVYQ